jgi:hypothetical protein
MEGGETVSHTVLLDIHIAVGALGLLLGPLAMWRDTRELGGGRRPTGGISAAYVWTVLAVSLSAIVLVVWYRSDLWWLIPVAVFSYALAALGQSAAARQFRGWSHAYVHGQGGSYIALVTALVVVALTVDGPVDGPAALIPWVLPTIVGTPLIESWRRRILRTLATRPATAV